MSHNIGLVVRPAIEQAKELAREIALWVETTDHSLTIDSETKKVIGDCSATVVESISELPEICDPIVTLGGDGTLIGVARLLKSRSPLMIGVNFGTLGFLTEISPHEALKTLKRSLTERVPSEERSMILARVYEKDKEDSPVFVSQALNEALVQKGSRDRLLDLDLEVNGEAVMRLRADGMLVATPTGSTAYSLAAGGSIAYPNLAVVLVTPICAHSLTSRPLILPLDFDISISVPEYDGEVFLSVDGQDSYRLSSGDRVVIERSPQKVCFATSPDLNYFEILRNKLNWGIANKSD